MKRSRDILIVSKLRSSMQGLKVSSSKYDFGLSLDNMDFSMVLENCLGVSAAFFVLDFGASCEGGEIFLVPTIGNKDKTRGKNRRSR